MERLKAKGPTLPSVFPRAPGPHEAEIGPLARLRQLGAMRTMTTESVLTDAAYFASRNVIVPIKPEFMATIGLPLLARCHCYGGCSPEAWE